MALTLDFLIKQSDNSRELTFTETTGSYVAGSNPGGWGSPNATLAQATSAVLTITDPDDEVYTLDIEPDSFPTNDSTQELTIRTQDLGLTADGKFTDGKWTFLYTVVANAVTYTSTQIILLSGQTRCSVFGLLASADVSACTDCDGSELARALEAYTYYRMAVAAAACGNSTKFQEIIDVLDKYIDSDCNCGCNWLWVL